MNYIFLKDFIFIYFKLINLYFGCAESLLPCVGFSLVAASRVCSLVAAYRLPIAVAFLVVEHGF